MTLRNSVSSVVLPEMVRRDRAVSRADSLALWKQATVTNTILLFPVVVIVVRFARPLVEAVFGRSYAPAALVLQIYMIAVLRECFDFAPALRAINCTRPAGRQQHRCHHRLRRTACGPDPGGRGRGRDGGRRARHLGGGDLARESYDAPLRGTGRRADPLVQHRQGRCGRAAGGGAARHFRLAADTRPGRHGARLGGILLGFRAAAASLCAFPRPTRCSHGRGGSFPSLHTASRKA